MHGRIASSSGTATRNACSLAISVLAARGARVLAVEDPGDSSIDGIARAASMRLAPIPVDEEGIDIDRLAASGRRCRGGDPRAPVAHGGRALCRQANRARRVGGAHRRLGHRRRLRLGVPLRPPADRGGAGPGAGAGRCSSARRARPHAPGVRLAWMAVPAALVADVAAARRAGRSRRAGGGPARRSRCSSSLGGTTSTCAACAPSYSSRRTALVEALRRMDPALSLTGLAAGFHGVLRLPAGLAEDAVIAAARDRSLRVVGIALVHASARGSAALADRRIRQHRRRSARRSTAPIGRELWPSAESSHGLPSRRR